MTQSSNDGDPIKRGFLLKENEREACCNYPLSCQLHVNQRTSPCLPLQVQVSEKALLFKKVQDRAFVQEVNDHRNRSVAGAFLVCKQDWKIYHRSADELHFHLLTVREQQSYVSQFGASCGRLSSLSLNDSTCYFMSDRKVAVLSKRYGKDWGVLLFHSPKHLLWVSKIPSLETYPFVLKNEACPLQASAPQRPWQLESQLAPHSHSHFMMLNHLSTPEHQALS